MRSITFTNVPQQYELLELAHLLVRPDQVASVIVNADNGVM